MIAALPNFLLYISVSIAVLLGSLAIYTLLTPMQEWALIRSGNKAAALTTGGALIGFALPLAESIRRSSDLLDMLAWAAVTVLVQLLGFGAMRLWRRDAGAAITAGDMAEAIVLASASVSLGLINAACLS
jgi:putative membrane protein